MVFFLSVAAVLSAGNGSEGRYGQVRGTERETAGSEEEGGGASVLDNDDDDDLVVDVVVDVE